MSEEPKGPLCFCGLRQTKNPHPEAGVPPGYLEVGTVYDCIPCLNKSRHAWAKRANKAEGEARELAAVLQKANGVLGQDVWERYAGLDEIRELIDLALEPK